VNGSCYIGLQNDVNRNEHSVVDTETLKNKVIDGRFRKQKQENGKGEGGDGSWRNSEEGVGSRVGSRIFSYDEFIITRAATGAKRK